MWSFSKGHFKGWTVPKHYKRKSRSNWEIFRFRRQKARKPVWLAFCLYLLKSSLWFPVSFILHFKTFLGTVYGTARGSHPHGRYSALLSFTTQFSQSSGLKVSISQTFQESFLSSSSLLPKETLFIFICLVLTRVSGTADRLYKCLVSGWKNMSRAVHCHINSSGVKIRIAEL